MFAPERELREKRDRLAERITEEHYRRAPELEARYGPIGRLKCREDALYHLDYLAEALAANQSALFSQYIVWANSMLVARGVSTDDLRANLQVLIAVLEAELQPANAAVCRGFIEHAKEQLEIPLPEHPELPGLAAEYLQLLLKGQRHLASALILDAVRKGTSVRHIYLDVFQRAQHEVGRLWQLNQITVAQEHYCTAATQLIMSQLYPHIVSAERSGPVLVATCVAGELHEIGVRMISDFFEMAGWDTYYIGANVPNSSVVEAVQSYRADCLAISATITAHVHVLRELVQAVRGAAPHVKILVGGHPFNLTSDLWRQVGADAGASDPAEAVRLATQWFP